MTPERWRQIEQLYHAALERTIDERAAFLAEACADDAALRREVEVLLAANDEAGSFLVAPALDLEARELAAERIPSLVGARIGRYQVLSQIGAGGMGEVYLAQDTTLSRQVALKLLPPRFAADPDR